MSDETRRYYNPVTLIVEHATPQYAALTGLVAWDGPTDETEVDKRNVERAVLAGDDLSSLKKPELQARAAELGLSSKGTVATLQARIEAHVAEVEAPPTEPAGSEEITVVVDSEAAPTDLHGDPADGEEEGTDPQKEGQ